MITLIVPPALKAVKGLLMQSPNPPIGTAYLAGMLKKSGYPYHVIDGVGEGLDRIKSYDLHPDLLVQGLDFDVILSKIPRHSKYIGVSVTFSTLWPISRELLKAIRGRFPDVTLIAGGEHVTAVPEYTLRNSEADILVLGEGEFTLMELLRAQDAAKPLKDVAGIAYLDEENGAFIRTSGIIRQKDLKLLPRPDWDSIPLERYISSGQLNGVNLGRSMPIIATRGCPYKCTFCSNVNMYTARWIPRDAKDVVDEIEENIAKFNVSNFNFQDLTAFVKKSWILDFTQEILKRGLKFTWQLPTGTRSEVFDEEVADHVYRAGCRNLSFAPESGDERVLRSVQKQVDLAALENAVRIALKRGISVTVFIVIGFPEDSAESMRNTLRFLRKMAWLGVHDAVVTKFQPYPGSPLFTELQQKGCIALDDRFFLAPMDFYSGRGTSFCENIGSKKLYSWMLYQLLNFYILSVLLYPLRTIKICLKALFTGYEETRYAKFLCNAVYTRTKWILRRA